MAPGADRLFEVLSRDECLALLVAGAVGRLAVSVADDAPFVVPVNFVMDGETVVFRSDPGTKLELALGRSVSFQLDEIDLVRQVGWSVLVRGKAYEITHWETEHLPLEPWVSGPRRRWVRIVPAEITGRRLALTEVSGAFDSRAYI
jgi:nitroimidazol reductase NimA-like FMN-containing flavoprotein (pyridoxamine 5'-phosphate oxidase superfamily)